MQSYRYNSPMSPLGDALTELHLSNLHCSSCVQTIEQSLYALEPKPALVEVSIVLQSVKIYHTVQLSEQDIKAALVNDGFDLASESSCKSPSLEPHPMHLAHCEACRGESVSPNLIKEKTEPRKLKVVLSVSGMTCATCTQSVTRAINDIHGVESVNVSLLDNAATVVLEDESLAHTIKDAIDDCGFEATIVSIDHLEEKPPLDHESRTISLQVEGMFCSHCPETVMSCLEPSITILKPLSLSDNILTISYVPAPPLFTIRSIIDKICSLSPAFTVKTYQPVSIEERSRIIQRRERKKYLQLFLLTLAAAVPTFVLGIVYMSLVKADNPVKQYLMEPIWRGNVSRIEWGLFIISTPVMFYSAHVFHRRSLKEIYALWKRGSRVPLSRRLTRFGSMNLLVSLGISIAYFSSVAMLVITAVQTQRGDEEEVSAAYFDSVVFLTLFLLAGRYLEAYSKSRTADAIKVLSSLRPEYAFLVVPAKDIGHTTFASSAEAAELADPDSEAARLSSTIRGQIKRIPVSLLEVGDTVRVPSGGSPPGDGVIIEGERGAFDESSMTGESKLVEKLAGDTVYVGTINRGPAVSIQINQIGGQTMLDSIVKVVREGQTRRAPMERVADRITGYFVPVITLLAILTWIIWLVLGLSGKLPQSYLDLDVGGWPLWSLQFSIAVFVVACPCGIGLAAPTALLVGCGLAAKFGVLARGGGEAFQEMSKVDIVVFDKTGTLTQGTNPTVSGSKYREDVGWCRIDILSAILTLESATTHPLAHALVQYVEAQGAHHSVATSFVEIAGKGVKATLTDLGFQAIIGNLAWMLEHGCTIDDDFSGVVEQWKQQGQSIVFVAVFGAGRSSFQIVAAFGLVDTIRAEASAVIRWIQRRGIQTWMISGDNETTAMVVANSVGIPSMNVLANVLPNEKADKIRDLQNVGSNATRKVVAMVGDGINDAPALTIADIGIAIGSGSDVAVSSASFVMLRSDLRGIAILGDLSKAVVRRVQFNFLWAILYNAAAVPIAAGVIYPVRHIRLDPVWASLAMALSSISVICSSLLLNLYKPPLIRGTLDSVQPNGPGPSANG